MDKRRCRRATALAGVLAVAAAAHAAGPAAATMMAPAPQGCEISVSKRQFDYGRFTLRPLDAQPGTGGEVIGRQLATVSVNCAQPRRVALYFRGPVALSDPAAYRFGEPGKVRLTLSRAQADGQRVLLGQGDPGAPALAWGEHAALVPGRGVVLQGGRPVSHLSMQMEATVMLPATATARGTAQLLSGNGQLEVQAY